MILTNDYLDSVDSIRLACCECECEIIGEWVACDGDAIIRLAPHICSRQDSEQTVNEAVLAQQTTNSDYAAALRVYDEFDYEHAKSGKRGEFKVWCKQHLNASTHSPKMLSLRDAFMAGRLSSHVVNTELAYKEWQLRASV